MIKELKNIKTYKIYSIFNNLLILGPIITLFYLAKGLSFTQIFLLNSIASITTILFEVPTGAVSDRISRKLSLIIGCILCGLSLVVFIFSPTFTYIIGAEIVFSIGLTFRSGTEQAILYDSLKNNNKVKDYNKIEGQARSYTFIAQAFGSIAAGFLYTLNINLPFIISIIFMVTAAVIACFFVEPQIEEKMAHNKYFEQIKESFSYVYNHKKVLGIILFSIVFVYFYRVGFNYFQPYMQAIGIPSMYFGVIFFLFNIVAATASRYNEKFMSLTKPRSLLALSFLLVVSFFLMSLIRFPLAVFFIFLQQVARGLRMPVFSKYMNKHIPSNKRATILSIQNLMTSLSIAIFAPLAGILLDKTDIFTSHLIIAFVMIIFILIVNQYMKYLIDRHPKVG